MCEPGWSGNTCEINIDDCIVPCKLGFTGGDQSANGQPCFEPRCYHSSRCVDKVDDFECVCSVGYEGLLICLLLAQEFWV